MSREVVAVSLDIFDRYVATKGNTCQGTEALLVSLTTLNIAIKLFDTKRVRITTLANLSRGQFTPADIEAMEWQILAALSWKLHPPTPFAFVSLMAEHLPLDRFSLTRKEFLELSRYVTELAVCDSFFVPADSSIVALATVLCVMDELSYTMLPVGLRERFLIDIRNRIGLSHQSSVVVACRDRLRSIISVSMGGSLQRSRSLATRSTGTNPESGSLAGGSLAGGSISSAGSTGSHHHYNRARANSSDSKSRFSASPHRRFLVANVSPMTSRQRTSNSPTVAGVQ